MRTRPNAQVRTPEPVIAVVPRAVTGQREVAHLVVFVARSSERLNEYLHLPRRLFLVHRLTLAHFNLVRECRLRLNRQCVSSDVRHREAHGDLEVSPPIFVAESGRPVDQVDRQIREAYRLRSDDASGCLSRVVRAVHVAQVGFAETLHADAEAVNTSFGESR